MDCQNYCLTFTVGKSSPQMWTSLVIKKKLTKVNNHPMGEFSPNLVTLLVPPLS
jgi:hypothetical protein